MFSKKKKAASTKQSTTSRKRPVCEVVHHFKAIHSKREKVAQRCSINPEIFKDFQLYSSLMLGSNGCITTEGRGSLKKSLNLYVPRKRSVRYTRDLSGMVTMRNVEHKKKMKGFHKRSKTCDDFEAVKQYFNQMSANAKKESKRSGKSKSISHCPTDLLETGKARESISLTEKRATIRLLMSQVSQLSLNDSSSLVEAVSLSKLDESEENKNVLPSKQQDLYLQISAGDEKRCIEILEKEFDSNDDLRLGKITIDDFWVDPESKCTLLHKAAKHQRLELLNYLISKGASVSSIDGLEATPLMYAVAQGHLKACYLLLNKGASPNVKDRYEQAPLHIAIRGGHLEVASTLLLFGADINFKGRQGYTALMQACEDGNITKVRYLLDNNANIFRTNRSSKNCLCLSLHHPHIVRHLLEHAKNDGMKQVVKLLMSSDDQGRTIFHHCVEGGYMTTFLEIVTIVCDNDEELLLGGITSENLQLKHVLNQKDSLGNTLLHYAVKFKRGDFVKILANSMEVDVTLQNNQGDTALHLALKENKLGNRRSRSSSSFQGLQVPMSNALNNQRKSSSFNTLLLLQQQQAQTDSNGRTLLSREAIEAVHLMLRFGENYNYLKNIKNLAEKKTPKQLAKENGIILKKLKVKDLNVMNYYVQYVQYSKSSSVVKFLSGGIGGLGSKIAGAVAPQSTSTAPQQTSPRSKRNTLIGGLQNLFGKSNDRSSVRRSVAMPNPVV